MSKKLLTITWLLDRRSTKPIQLRLSLLLFLFVRKAWPEDALEMVANKFLDDVEMSYNVRKEVVLMCKYIHEGVRSLSEKYAIFMLRKFVFTVKS